MDDVLGGDEAWENVDQTESPFSSLLYFPALHLLNLSLTLFLLSPGASALSEMRQHEGLLDAAPDPECRRAHDDLLVRSDFPLPSLPAFRTCN